MLKRIKELYEGNKILKIEWIVATAIAIGMLCLFCYEDLKAYTIWSLNLLDVTFSGRIYEFYSYSAENIYGLASEYVGGNFVGLIPWAIWNMPLWLLEKIGIISRDKFVLEYIWSHLFLVFCLFSCFIVLRRICEILAVKDRVEVICYMFLTSPFIYIGVYYSGQSDILTIFFFLLAIYSLLKKDKKFLFWAMITVTIKPFYILAYIGLVLLYEKRLLRVFGKIFIMFSGMLIFHLIFYMAPLYRESIAQGPTNRVLKEALWGRISGVFGTEASLVVISLIMVYFMAYISKRNDDNAKSVIYYSFAPLLCFFMFAQFDHYRIAILVPALYLVIAINKRYFRINMIVATVINLSALICICYQSTYIFNTRYMDETVFSYLCGMKVRMNENSISSVLHSITNSELLVTIASACFVAGAIILLFINCPREVEKKELVEEKCERWLIWCNSFAIIPILFLMGILYS